jgi:inner membrane protein
MLFITHVLVNIFFILLFFPFLKNPLSFLFVSLFATIIPDIDSQNSKLGKFFLFKPINFFIKHRGIMHSVTFMILIGLIFFIFFEDFLSAFLWGYSIHLLLDCLTLQGVYIFYPLKIKIRGKIKTGGLIESALIIFCLFGIFFLVFYRFLG